MTHGTGREAGQEARFQKRLAVRQKSSRVASLVAIKSPDMETVHPSLERVKMAIMKPSRWPSTEKRPVWGIAE
jgi:hypothetical protein